MRKEAYLTFLLAIGPLVTGCQGPPEDGESESSGAFLVAPPQTVPGSRGGPCGKGYANCKTAESLAKKYRELKVSSLKRTGCTKNGKAIQVIHTYKLPKLVADGGSSDTMRLIVAANTDSAGTLLMFWEVERNGANVASLFGQRFSSGSNEVIPDAQSIDVMRGGFEAVLHLQNPAIQNAVRGGLQECDNSDVNQSSGHTVCAACHLTPVLVAAATGFGSGAVAAIAGLGKAAAGAVGGASGAAGGVLARFLDCSKMCRIEACNRLKDECIEDNCTGRTGTARSTCVDICDDAMYRCCGYEGGVCYPIPGNNRCNFCSNKPGARM